jgi:hypothetical protein
MKMFSSAMAASRVMKAAGAIQPMPAADQIGFCHRCHERPVLQLVTNAHRGSYGLQTSEFYITPRTPAEDSETTHPPEVQCSSRSASDAGEFGYWARL